MGQHRRLPYLMHVYTPRSFLCAGDMGHLGTGLPFALAAKLAHPDKDVFLLHGDGTFLPEANEYWMDDRPVTFTFHSPYSAYIDLMMGRLDAIRAITKGVLKLKGPMTKILRYVKSTNLWVDILRSIPTEFEGAFADWSFGD